ncbi:MAG TPA: hypothetical protein VIY70_10220 [Acidimicrobiia bacterium]
MRRSTLVLALALSVAACTPTEGAGTSTSTTSTAVEPPAPTTSTAAEATTSTTEPADTGFAPLPGTESLPVDLQMQIADLVAVTEDLRELEFLRPPTITVVSQDELAERVRALLAEETEDIPADEALLELLGLIPEDLDLLSLYTDLYGEQVAGFYDGDTEEMVVPATDEAFTALQKATLVHELTHALTDQRLEFSDRFDALIEEERFDEVTAFQSVIEGDATLTEVLYITGLPFEEQQAVLAESFAADRTVFDGAPSFIQGALLFPYDSGFSFTQRLYDIGGFDEINRVYLEPPNSTEQIITPRDFERDLPRTVDLVLDDPAGYERVYETVWGELSFVLMFDQVLGDGAADDAADGWGGDEYIQWFDGDRAAMALDVRTDSDEDALELEEAILAYVAAAMDAGEGARDGVGTVFSDGVFAFVARTGDRVVFIVADDPSVGEGLRAEFTEF